MFKLPADDPHADVRQWVNNGVFIDTRTELALSSIGVESIRRFVQGVRIPREVDGYAPTENVPFEHVALHWPLCGAVNNYHYKFALVVERLPRRQYSRTYCPAQVNVAVPRGYEVLSKLKRNQAVSASHPDVLQAVLYPQYPDSLDTAREWLNDGWASVAMNRRMTIVPSDDTDKLLLYRGMTHVGHIIGRTYIPVVHDNAAMKVLKSFKGELSL